MTTLLQVALAAATTVLVSHVTAQDLTYPGKPALQQFVSPKYAVSIGLPVGWKLDPPHRNEVWLSVGKLRGSGAACFVRVSTVEHLHLSTPDSFFDQMDEASFVKLNSLSMPDLRVHRYDIAYLGDRKSRRVLYSGTDSGVRTATVTYQSLDNDNLSTVGCVSESTSFQALYNDFESVISSFRFRRKMKG